MACFPRWRFARQKNSFNPAQDDNTETLLNVDDGPVQIGRYIQREETPVFTPKHSARVQKVQFKEPNTANGLGSSFNKNFTPTKSKIAAEVAFKNPQANATSTKFKPVRERRPTALPTDVPKIEEDLESDIEVFNNSESATPTTNTARFFIGSSEVDEDSSSNYTRISETQLDCALPPLKIPTNGPHTSLPGTPTTTPNTPNGDVGDQSSVQRLNSNTSHVFLPKPSSTLQRNKKKGPPPASRCQERQPDLKIPRPPPLPPQPLVTVASSSSLLSNRSGKSKRRQSCDSQPELKDSNATPKDSDSSEEGQKQTHRIDGGIIFTRPNLPVQKDVEIEYISKDDVSRNLIRTAIEKNDFLNNYMDKERKEMVIDAMEPATYAKHSYIIKENDEGSEIFVSAEGTFNVLKGEQVIATFGPATVFGELAILYNATRFASIQATTEARVWKIGREKFRKIMVISGSKEREENLNFLHSAPFLNDLSDEVLNKVVDLLQRKFYETGACIVREGDVGNEFYIIRGGTVTIKKKSEDGEERIVDRRKKGDYFGEQALLNADTRQASVYADAPGTEVLKLDREAFISYMGTIPQLHEIPESTADGDERNSNRQNEFNNKYAHIQLDELKKITTLGAGAFGRVDLVENGGQPFALKIIKKIDVIKQDQVEHIYSEKHVMMKCSSSPFIVELYKTFRDDKYVYFLMEACMGGDVWTIMSQRRFFDEKTARFIAGCVVEAFEFLHSRNIIYRDLKPENLMLTNDGYCKLVDFGFAKNIPQNQKTNTFAGTPEYVAPEIILDRGHDRAVDYWALGILIFELLVGKTPFRGQNQIKIYQQILGGIDVIPMPSKIPKSAQGLIKSLCKQLPAERLGYQRKGITDIKKHSWFEPLDWHKLKNKQLTSPIKRPLSSSTDTQYFGPPGIENEYDPPDENSGWDVDF